MSGKAKSSAKSSAKATISGEQSGKYLVHYLQRVLGMTLEYSATVILPSGAELPVTIQVRGYRGKVTFPKCVLRDESPADNLTPPKKRGAPNAK